MALKLWRAVFVAVACVVALAFAGYDHVKLEVYIESGCPISQAFLLGELTTVLAMPDIVNIIDFKYVPFGNSFFNETTKAFQCYDEVECQTDSLQLCALYKYSDDIRAINTGVSSYPCFPFISCMEANKGVSTFGESCWESTMSNATDLTWQTISTCAESEYTKVMVAGDLATPQWLTAVPLVLVNGKPLQNPDSTLLPAICLAYEGPKPDSCKAVQR